MKIPGNPKGVALTLVIVIMIMLGLIAGVVTSLGISQKKLMDAASGRRAKIYYRAQGGVINADWRIRTDYTTGLSPAGTFTNDAYDPGPYSLDVDGDGTNDTTVDIGAVTNVATKARPVYSCGCDGAAPCPPTGNPPRC